MKGFSRQEFWSGLPFPSPVDHILSDLSTMTRLSWVAPRAWLSFIEADKPVVLVWLDWLVFCDYGFSVSALWCLLTTPTILLGFLLPWTWVISSWLLQQSGATAPYLGQVASPHCCPSWPWTWSSSSRHSCACAASWVLPITSNFSHFNSLWEHRSKFQGGFPQGYLKKNLSLSLAEPVSWNMKREGLKWKKALPPSHFPHQGLPLDMPTPNAELVRPSWFKGWLVTGGHIIATTEKEIFS